MTFCPIIWTWISWYAQWLKIWNENMHESSVNAMGSKITQQPTRHNTYAKFIENILKKYRLYYIVLCDSYRIVPISIGFRKNGRDRRIKWGASSNCRYLYTAPCGTPTRIPNDAIVYIIEPVPKTEILTKTPAVRVWTSNGLWWNILKLNRTNYLIRNMLIYIKWNKMYKKSSKRISIPLPIDCYEIKISKNLEPMISLKYFWYKPISRFHHQLGRFGM